MTASLYPSPQSPVLTLQYCFPYSQMEHRARVEPGIWFNPAPVCKLEDTVLLITEFGVKQFDPALLQVTDLPAALWHHRASVS